MRDRPGQPRGDAHWMRRALVLARPHLAACWPNPAVGACVVRDGELLGEGVHLGPGCPHAEVAALDAVRSAGADPTGSTVYVTLEPCHHTGRTPPCSSALVEAGVARVVYAVDDSNPRAPGGGAAWLREQGVEVVGGLLDSVAAEMIHAFFETSSDEEVHWTLKLALGADGTLAPGGVDLRDPRARRITGPMAHRRSHRLRAGVRAVVVGAGTVIADRPRLDVRHLPRTALAGPGPRPVVLDTRLRCRTEDLPAKAIVFHADGATVRPADSVEHVEIECDETGLLDWSQVESELSARGLGLVLVEGGARVAESLLASHRPHRVHLFESPRRWPDAAVRVDLAVRLDRDYRRVRDRPLGADRERVYVRKDLPRLPGQDEE